MVRSLPVRRILDAVAGAAARWSDGAFAARVGARDAVSKRTGYSPASVEYAFDRLFFSLTRPAIEAVIADELGSLDCLDGFVKRVDRPPARALPVGRVCVISSRTTIGVALLPAVFALCAKCEVLVKDREDHLVAAFFDALAAELPELRGIGTARPWRGESDEVDLGAFDAVVAFGSDATLRAIAAALDPKARFIAYPPKTSAGYVAREALMDERAAAQLARAAARDALLYDGEGCLSLHALFVQRGGAISPGRVCELLREAMESDAFESRPSATISARLAMARDLARLRGATVACDDRASYLIVLDAALREPPLLLPRSLSVYAVDDFTQAMSFLGMHGIMLEALAVAKHFNGLAATVATAGAARIAPFGALQAPPLGGFHGGRPRITEFVRWISDET